MSSYPSYVAYPSAPPVRRGMPAPPRLHWGVVLGLSVITFGCFGMIWICVQAWWVKKVTGNAKPFGWGLAWAGSFVVVILAAFLYGALAAARGETVDSLEVSATSRLLNGIFYLLAAYTLRSALEHEPIGIPLSGVMTFFFAPTYFQYHLHDLDVSDRWMAMEPIAGGQIPGVTEP